MVRKWKITLLLTLVVAMLSGCFSEKPVLEELGKDSKGKIKVVYYDEDSFYSEYGDSFNIKYPDIEFEVVNQQEMYREIQDKGEDVDYQEEMQKFLDKHKPDVLMIDLKMMEKMAKEGKLYNLDAVIAQETFDLEGYIPGLIDMIRGKGSGSLYGLAPNFYTNVIFYNAELFREHNIEPPRNKMTWQEIIDLSSRFTGIGSGENQIYGYYERFGTAEQLLNNIATGSSLRLFDPKGEKLVFNTDGWKRAMKLASDAIRNKSVYTQPMDDNNEHAFMEDDDLFFKGRAAMIIEGPWFISQLKNKAMWDKEAKPIDWGMVTAPVDPAAPDESSYARLNEVFAITADSPNKRAAWEFVKFVNGPELAKAASRSARGNLPTRNQFVKEIDGKSTEAFYLLRPKAESDSMWDGTNVEVPPEFYSEFRTILLKGLKAVIDGKKTVEEAAAAIQAEGEIALQKGREAEQARKDAQKKSKGESGKAAEDNRTEGTGSAEAGTSKGD